MIWRKKILVRDNFSFFHSVPCKKLIWRNFCEKLWQENSVICTVCYSTLPHNVICKKTRLKNFTPWRRDNSSRIKRFSPSRLIFAFLVPPELSITLLHPIYSYTNWIGKDRKSYEKLWKVMKSFCFQHLKITLKQLILHLMIY